MHSDLPPNEAGDYVSSCYAKDICSDRLKEKLINSMLSRIMMKRKDHPKSLVSSGVAVLGQGDVIGETTN
jgi:hypothetical protein